MIRLFSIFILPLLPVAAIAVDYKNDVLPIMKKHCFECHSGGNAKGSLDLENLSEMRDYQVGKFNIIRPGNPEESSFLEKMHLPTSDRDFMPRKGTKLPDDDLDTIAKWIKEGAVIDAENPVDSETEWVKKSGGASGGSGMASQNREFLKWTSSDGKEIEARFLGLSGEAAKLLMKNGKSYTVPFSRLHPDSVATAKKMAGQ
ncbi:MAG: hypothetical protein P1U89_22350 [Verrucomicrobiales bacterium]|nr:hypothetical protein [Verrucomicrobiales bacterium]